MDDVTLRRADEDALSDVERLLAASDLPSADVRSGPGRFYVGDDDGERVGVGGLEVHGTDALLRSVVVPEPARGRGYGTALCAVLEARARDAGVDDLYLLTTTAGTSRRRATTCPRPSGGRPSSTIRVRRRPPACAGRCRPDVAARAVAG